MKRPRSFLVALLAGSAWMVTASTVHALANRVFVSARSGNNANACDNILTPCQTFAGAVLQLNPGGEIIVLDSGGYGAVTITQAVTIEAPAGVLAFIHPSSGDAITINAGASDTVILRGLTLNGGSNNGITVNTVDQLFVEHCSITGYGNNGINFAAPGGILIMRDDDVRKCSHDGVLVISSGTVAKAFVRDSNFASCANGGLVAGGGSRVVVEQSSASNAGAGFLSITTGTADADLTLDHVQVTYSAVGFKGSASGGGTATLRFAYCVVTHNTVGLSDDSGTASLVGSNPGTSVVAANATDISATLPAGMTLR